VHRKEKMKQLSAKNFIVKLNIISHTNLT
jgi:hypothetical protein